MYTMREFFIFGLFVVCSFFISFFFCFLFGKKNTCALTLWLCDDLKQYCQVVRSDIMGNLVACLNSSTCYCMPSIRIGINGNNIKNSLVMLLCFIERRRMGE